MTAGLVSVTHFRSSDPAFAERAQDALAALAARPGYLRGTIGRSTDEADAWLLVTEWENVGSYRRALGNYDVKLRATPLLGEAIDLPSSFEALADVAAGGDRTVHSSDLA
jgi:heme oxygenase (mycobilin-producing)